MPSYLIGIGSNECPERWIPWVKERILDLFPEARFAKEIPTRKVGAAPGKDYVNTLCRLETSLSQEHLEAKLKDLERQAGRDKSSKERGIVTLDLDILMEDTMVLKTEDLHRTYNQLLIAQLDRNMRYLGIIPARYASTRFPGKPLALLGGKPIIQWVYETVSKAVDLAVVATDDERILDCVKGFGGRAVMTSTEHRSGTDRCREAMEKVGEEFDVVINIQGDEPFITVDQIQLAQSCFLDTECQIATLIKPFTPDQGIEALENPNSPKVVVDGNMYAQYFSRSVIPYLRGVEKKDWLGSHTFYKHIGLYAFRPKVLEEVTDLEQGILEKAESLEQLRWIENGYRIKTAVTNEETVGIDTPEDLEKASQILSTRC